MQNLIQLQPRFLSLDSCAYNHIDNIRLLEISPFEVNLFQIFDAEYGARVTRRGEPTPHYNCHGMTFASRRTGVIESTVVQQILDEDNYHEVPENSVLPGDVILYFDVDGDIEHSGVVIEEPKPENLNIPLICSKWGKYAELLHLRTHCPYNVSRVKYYRMNYDQYAAP